MGDRHRNLIRRYVMLLAALVCFLPVAVFGQVATATITGTVTDQQGAVIPEVKVSVKNVGTGVVREIQTGSGGAFVVPLLPVGTYTISAEKTGFKTLSVPGITLATGDNVREDLQLQVGAVTQTIEVTGAPPALQTENSTLGSLINPTATESLPLNGRNVQGLMVLVAGSSTSTPNTMASGNRPDDRRPTSAASLNGQSALLNNFQIDGADNNEREVGSIVVKPQIDALAEVKIDANDYSADVSRTSGGVISFVTKSGTDQFHGSVYEFLRNTDLDARNFFDIPNRGAFHQNQFGGSLGGPIQKGKMFFFGDFEGLRVVQGEAYAATIPTMSMKQGNFGAVPNVQADTHIFNPYTNVTSNGVTTRTEYPGDIIPAASSCTGAGALFPQGGCLDPVTSQIVNFYPNATAAGPSNYHNSSNDLVRNMESFDGRIDRAINSKNTLFGRYSFNQLYSILPGKFPLASATLINQTTGASTTLSGVQGNGGTGNNYYGSSNSRAMNALLDWTRIFSPTFVMDLKASYTRFNIITYDPNYGKNVMGDLGVPNVAIDTNTEGMSSMAIQGYDYLGDNPYLPLHSKENGFEGVGNLNWQHGSHNIKFGGRYERRLNGMFQSNFPMGRFTFDANLTNDPTNTHGTGNAVASFLVGTPSGTSRSVSLEEWGYQLYEAGLYVQDQWQATKSLTINLGVRWDYFPYVTEKYNRFANIDFQMNPYALVDADTNGLGPRVGVKVGGHDFQPRIGFAQRFGANTVLRGGFGVSFVPQGLGSVDTFRNPPYVALYTQSATALNYVNTVDQGFPGLAGASTTNPLGTLRPVAMNFPNPYAMQMNLTLERNVSGYIFRLAGVMVNGRHEWNEPNINQAPPAPSAAGSVASRRPFHYLWPSAGDIQLSEGGSSANYSSLQFTVEHRYSHGLSLLANYSWSKGLDDNDEWETSGTPDSQATAPRRVLSAHGRRIWKLR